MPQRIRSITEPAIATLAPTEISCPPDAAVTRVIPIARIASSEPLSSIVIIDPDKTGFPKLFCPSVILKKFGSIIKLNKTSRTNAARGIIN